MRSTKNTAGFYSQMLFLYYFLMSSDKKVQWSYEGDGENQGDFIIENIIYEAKTSVSNNVPPLRIKESLPPAIKRALAQLVKTKSNFSKKIIVTNQQVIIASSQKLDNVLQEFKLYNLGLIAPNDKINISGQVIKIENSDNVFVFSIPVENGENMKFLEKKIYFNLELSEFLGTLDTFSTVCEAWRGFISKKASHSQPFNAARIVTYFAASDTLLSGDYQTEDIDEYIWLIKQINKLKFIYDEYGEKFELIYEQLKEKTSLSDHNLRKIIEKTLQKSEQNLEILKGVIYDQKNWNL